MSRVEEIGQRLERDYAKMGRDRGHSVDIYFDAETAVDDLHYLVERLERIEEAARAWAKAHPEPVCPFLCSTERRLREALQDEPQGGNLMQVICGVPEHPEDIEPGTWLAVNEDGSVRPAKHGEFTIGRTPTEDEAVRLPATDPGFVHVVVDQADNLYARILEDEPYNEGE